MPAPFPSPVVNFWTLNGSNDIYNNNFSGKVGIGTLTPAQPLDVVGTVQVTALTLRSLGGGVITFADGTTQSTAAGAGTSYWTLNGSNDIYNNNSSGKVGIGTNAPESILDVRGDGTNPTVLTIKNGGAAVHTAFEFFCADGSGTGAYRGIFAGNKSRGTLASPTAVVSGDWLFSVLANGHDGTNFLTKGSLDFMVDGTVGTGVVPISISFKTSATSSDRSERMVIKADGKVGIGTNAPAVLLDLYESTDAYCYMQTKASSATKASGIVCLNNNNNYSDLVAYGSSAPNYVWDDNTVPRASACGFELASPTFNFIRGITNVPLCIGTNGLERMRILANGNVGIGTTNPGANLHVVNSIKAGAATSGGGDGTGTLALTYGAQAYFQANENLGTCIIQNYHGSGGAYRDVIKSSLEGNITVGSGSGAVFVDRVNGRTGIGLTNPQSTLHVNGVIKSGASSSGGGDGTGTLSLTYGSQAYVRANENLCTFIIQNYDGPGLAYRDVLKSTSAGGITVGSGNAYIFVDRANNKTGIGTTSPALTFDVWHSNTTAYSPSAASVGATRLYNKHNSGGVTASALQLQVSGNDGTTSAVAQINAVQEVAGATGTALAFTLRKSDGNYAEWMRIASDGKVGIGTDAPGVLLEITKSQNTGTSMYVMNPNAGNAATSNILIGYTVAGGKYGYLSYCGDGYGGGVNLFEPNRTIICGAGAGGLLLVSGSAPVLFATGGVATSNERMRILADGKIGIGTTSPDFQLDVNGDVRIEEAHVLYFGGTGSGDADVNLYRSGANTLKTDDSFFIAGTTLDIENSGVTVVQSFHSYNDGSTARALTQYLRGTDNGGSGHGWDFGINSDTVSGDDFILRTVAGSASTKLKVAYATGNFDFIPATHTLYVDAANNRVGISDAAPDFLLDVAGDIRIQGSGTTSNKLYFGGSGASDNDVNLYKSAADTLKSDDALIVADLTVGAHPMMPSYGELYEDNESGSAITLTTGGTYYQWVTSTVGTCKGTGYVVGSATSDDLTIGASGAGVYRVSFSVSFSGSNNELIDVAIHKGGARQANIVCDKLLNSTGDKTGVSASGILTLAASDTIDLRFSATNSSKTVTVYHVNLNIERIG